MYASFDKKSDKAGLSLTFSCHLLFVNMSDSVACKWSSSSTVMIDVLSTETILLNQVLKVRKNLLRAECPSGSRNQECDLWPTSSDQQCTVLAPVTPLVPYVAIDAPALVDSCSDFLLDVSFSSGSGGQRFSSSTVVISSSTGAPVETIQSFFDSYFTTALPISLPSSHLKPLQTYSIDVTLCNFFGMCNSNSHVWETTNTTMPVPQVILPGGKQRYAFRREQIVVDAVAFLSSCNDESSSPISTGLLFNWKVYLNGAQISVLSSASSRESRFLVNPYTLRFDRTYSFEVEVTSESSGSTVVARTNMNLVHGDIVAKFGDNFYKRSIRYGDEEMLDGSFSYDEDYDMDNEESGVIYSWKCIQLLPVQSASCGLSFTAGGSGNSFVFVTPSSPSYVGSTSRVTLTVKSSDGSRYDSTYVDYYISNSSSPFVAMSSSDEVLPSDQLKLFANVSLLDNEMSWWSCDDESVDLVEYPGNSISNALTPGDHQLELVLPGNALSRDSTFSFSLVVDDIVSSVTVYVLYPPSGGIFYVNPSVGEEFSELFVMSTSRWLSNELPLTYRFGFVVGSLQDNFTNIIGYRSAYPHTSQLWLPAGQVSANYALTSVVYVYDNMGSTSSVSTSVKVLPGSFSSSDFNTIISNSFSSTSPNCGMERIRELAVSSSNKMNRVLCDEASDCYSLHRQECLYTPHTCGACETDFFGVIGDANSLCYSVNDEFAESSRLSSSCVLSSECYAGQVCKNGLCSYLSKECKPACSSNGKCIFRDLSSGLILDECLDNDVNCEAVCLCDDGFGGIMCSNVLGDISMEQQTRNKIIEKYSTTLPYGDATYYNVLSDLQLIRALSMNTAQLSSSSCESLIHIMEEMVQRIHDFDIQISDALILYGALDRCDKYTASNASLLGSQTCGRKGGTILPSIMYLIELKMNLGDSPESEIMSLSRFSIDMGSAVDSRTFRVPRSALEVAFGVQKSSLFISSENIVLSSGYSPVANPVTVGSISEAAALLFCNYTNFISNPVKLSLALSPGYEVNLGGNFTARLEFFRSQQFHPSSNQTKADRIMFVTNCSMGNVSVNEYICPTGEVITHSCPGKYKDFVSLCPEVLYLPSCSILVNGTVLGSYDNENCQTKSYTSEYIECSCLFSKSIMFTSETIRARKSSESKYMYSGEVEVVASGYYIAEGSVESFNTPGYIVEDEESTSRAGIIVLAIVWGLIVCFLLGIIFANVGSTVSTHPGFMPKRAFQILNNVKLWEKKPFIINYLNHCLPEVYQSFRKNEVGSRLFTEIYRNYRYAPTFFGAQASSSDRRLKNGLQLLVVWSTLIFLVAMLLHIQVNYPYC